MSNSLYYSPIYKDEILVNEIVMENDTLIHSPDEKVRTTAIRVSLMEKEDTGPFLGLSLDEEKPEDESFEVQGLTFIVDKNLLELCGAINIDFVETDNNPGFKVTAANPLLSRDDNFRSVPCGSPGVFH